MIDGNSALALAHAVLTSPRGDTTLEWSALLDAFEEAGLPAERMRSWGYEAYLVPTSPQARSHLMGQCGGSLRLAARRCLSKFATELERVAYLRGDRDGFRICRSQEEAEDALRKMFMTDAGAEMFEGLSGGIW